MLDVSDPLAFCLRWLFTGTAVGFYVMLALAWTVGL